MWSLPIRFYMASFPLHMCSVAQLCLTLCDPMDGSTPGSPLHGILQARTLEQVAISFFRVSSQPRDQTSVSCLAGIFFTSEPPGNPHLTSINSVFSSLDISLLGWEFGGKVSVEEFCFLAIICQKIQLVPISLLFLLSCLLTESLTETYPTLLWTFLKSAFSTGSEPSSGQAFAEASSSQGPCRLHFHIAECPESGTGELFPFLSSN